MHADFVRVVAGQKLVATVAIHFMNQEAAVKKGGEISHVISEVEISCLPKDLPEFIEVDLADAEVGTIIHLSDVKAPAGVEFVALAHGNDLAVANVHAPRVQAEEDGEGSAE
jgi:large subunit ribosomal protein L25